MNKITVAIPTYNRDNYLRQAIASVLEQNDVEFELLILDTASPVNVKEIVDSFNDTRIRYVYHPVNLGMIGAGNRCIELCKTEFLMILPDDDRLLKGGLKRLYDRIAHDPQIDAAIGSVLKIDDAGQVTGEELTTIDGSIDGIDFYKWYLTGKFAVQICAVLFRTSVLDKVGQFDSRLRYCPDMDLWLRIALQGQLSLVAHTVAEYRAHEGTATTKYRANAELARSYQALLKKQYGLARSAYIFEAKELEEIFHYAISRYVGSFTAHGLDCFRIGQVAVARQYFAIASEMTPRLSEKLYLSALSLASFGGVQVYSCLQRLKRLH